MGINATPLFGPGAKKATPIIEDRIPKMGIACRPVRERQNDTIFWLRSAGAGPDKPLSGYQKNGKNSLYSFYFIISDVISL